MHVLGNLHEEADGAMVTCMVRRPGTRPKRAPIANMFVLGITLVYAPMQ